jgi:DNA-binding MarR family transcriptional regulator
MNPDALDLGHLALFVGMAAQDDVLAALHAAGFPELRVAHGFVFQHLVEADRTLVELAERMEVSPQAAHKAVAELVDLGYLERANDPSDGRIRRVALSARGRAAVDEGRAIRRRCDEAHRARFGARLDDARAVLVEILADHPQGARIRGRRLRWAT